MSFSLTLSDILDTVPEGNFKQSLHFTLLQEGIVFEDVAGDPGGVTCCGITQSDYDQYRHEHGMAAQSVGLMTAPEFGQVYTAHYWQPLRCACLPFAVALAMFDTGVNVGIVSPARWLQGELGVTVDGNIGPNTLAAAAKYVSMHGADQIAKAVLQQRKSYYLSRGAWADPFRGDWLRRCADLAADIGVALA